MDDTVRENLRRRLRRVLDALHRLNPSPAVRALQPIPVESRNARLRRAQSRAIRPVRAWSRLTREDILGVRPRHFSA